MSDKASDQLTEVERLRAALSALLDVVSEDSFCCCQECEKERPLRDQVIRDARALAGTGVSEASGIIGWEVVSRDPHLPGSIDNNWDAVVHLKREDAEKAAAEANASGYGTSAGVEWFVVELRADLADQRAAEPDARVGLARLRDVLEDLANEGGGGMAGRVRAKARAALAAVSVPGQEG